MGASNFTESADRVRYKIGFRPEDTHKANPMFLEYIGKTKPDPWTDFHMEKNGSFYMSYKRYEGLLDTMEVKEDTFPVKGGKTETVNKLILGFKEFPEDTSLTKIDVNSVTGQYARNLMLRLLNPSLDLTKPFTISPYNYNVDGKERLGIVVYQGEEEGRPKKIESLNQEQCEALGIPLAEVKEFNGKTIWDFTKQTRSIYGRLRNKLQDAFFNDGSDFVEPPPPPAQEPSKGDIGKTLYDLPKVDPPAADPFVDDVNDDLPF
jgi:hypothetical protein